MSEPTTAESTIPRDREEPLIVAIDGPEPYAKALASGHAWPVSRVPLSSEWQRIRIPFDAFRHEGDGEKTPMRGDNGSALHFIVDSGQAGALWIDDVELGCNSAECRGN